MRCLTYLSIIGALLFCGTAAAQTPAGEPYAEEGVCDDLLWATPGLYGLCVAFCEAQDCQLTINAVSGEVIESDPNCMPSSLKLLDVYNRRRSIDDPPMPCVNEVTCPCWSDADTELPNLSDNPVCTADGKYLSLTSGWGLGIEGAFVNSYVISYPDGEPPGGGVVWGCFYGRPFPIAYWTDIDQQEYDVCAASIVNECSSRGLWPPSE